jgi:hypothetical protein
MTDRTLCTGLSQECYHLDSRLLGLWFGSRADPWRQVGYLALSQSSFLPLLVLRDRTARNVRHRLLVASFWPFSSPIYIHLCSVAP